MTLLQALDQPALFSFSDPQTGAGLSERERRLLVGALNFHSLMAPERTLRVHLYDGSVDTTPRLTDDTTFTGMSRNNRERLETFEIVSAVRVEEREPERSEAESVALVAASTRHLHISSDDVLAADPYRPPRPGLIGGIARQVKSRAPLLYDDARDLSLMRFRKKLTTAIEPRNYTREFLPGGEHEDDVIVLAPSAPEGAQKAVIIGLHWFELGGAELWAFETVRLVREAGFLPIVVSNRDSHQPWVTRPELDGALIVPFSEPTVESQTPGVEQLLRGLLRTFDVRGVVTHHNQWLYDRVAWIAASRPGIPIVDSTHIVEYGGGGYPLSSAIASRSMTKHHVISPSLAAWMTDVQRIPVDRVVMAPLGGLTVKPKDAEFRSRASDEPFTVAFVGRMARQKAPEVFVAMAHRLKRQGHTLRFILHGDGELSSWVDDIIAADGMTADIIRRTSGTPVSETLDEAHVLVVASHNEGLTLTTLEAIAHGVPVISTDVGAQGDIIPPSALVPRYARVAARRLAETVAPLVADESAREALWRKERKAEKKLLSQQSASSWFEKEVGSW
ncbi:glycosyltransferase [Microbacterium phyllosphaerae]|uniref:glycosyltransferase n=1 Tax=Microbacterium phyllosphaerae TaxID=124798 RepID=UPI000EA369DD|nr:glycosyltransferase [Microbacterium phyllosphaerae]